MFRWRNSVPVFINHNHNFLMLKILAMESLSKNECGKSKAHLSLCMAFPPPKNHHLLLGTSFYKHALLYLLSPFYFCICNCTNERHNFAIVEEESNQRYGCLLFFPADFTQYMGSWCWNRLNREKQKSLNGGIPEIIFKWTADFLRAVSIYIETYDIMYWSRIVCMYIYHISFIKCQLLVKWITKENLYFGHINLRPAVYNYIFSLFFPCLGLWEEKTLSWLRCYIKP